MLLRVHGTVFNGQNRRLAVIIALYFTVDDILGIP